MEAPQKRFGLGLVSENVSQFGLCVDFTSANKIS
jgi:hypothetical protein